MLGYDQALGYAPGRDINPAPIPLTGKYGTEYFRNEGGKTLVELDLEPEEIVFLCASALKNAD